MELLRNSKDKRARKLTKKRVSRRPIFDVLRTSHAFVFLALHDNTLLAYPTYMFSSRLMSLTSYKSGMIQDDR